MYDKSQLSKLKSELSPAMALPEHVLAILKALPKQTQSMDALRTAASALGAADPDLASNERDADRRKAIRLTAQLPTPPALAWEAAAVLVMRRQRQAALAELTALLTPAAPTGADEPVPPFMRSGP